MPPALLKYRFCKPFFNFIICQTSVNSDHPIGIRSLQRRALVLGGGTKKVKAVLKPTLGVGLLSRPTKIGDVKLF